MLEEIRSSVGGIGLYNSRRFKNSTLIFPVVPEACSPSGAVRLVWGAGPWEGNVQICLNGGWGWICQNSFYTNEAKVVCRQLGFNATGKQNNFIDYCYFIVVFRLS